jgi:RNA polymerase primary sigma factor
MSYSTQLNHRLLSQDEEVALAKRMERGDNRARDELITSNLRLAASIAKNYYNSGEPVCDILQEANVGLIKAVDRFDWKKGFRFSTYAVWWIKQSIRRYLSKETGSLKFPIGSRHMIWKINQIRRDYEAEFNCQPDDAEVANILGVSEKEVTQLRMAMQWPVNINAPIGGEDGSRTYADVIPDEDLADPVDRIMGQTMVEILKNAFATLTPQEERVLRMRFGIVEVNKNDYIITEDEIKNLKKESNNVNA